MRILSKVLQYIGVGLFAASCCLMTTEHWWLDPIGFLGGIGLCILSAVISPMLEDDMEEQQDAEAEYTKISVDKYMESTYPGWNQCYAQALFLKSVSDKPVNKQ